MIQPFDMSHGTPTLWSRAATWPRVRRWRRHLEGRRLLRALGKRWISAWRSRRSPRASPNGHGRRPCLSKTGEANRIQASGARPPARSARRFWRADAVGSLRPAPWFEGCRGFTTPESPLDARLLAPDSRASEGPFGGRYPGRLAHLDLPDEISPGTGLILPQNHGTPPPEARIGARATLPVATRLGNPIGKRVNDRSAPASWTVSRMVRQPTVEPFLEGSRQAGHSRPAAPFRSTAAWIMGPIRGQKFIEFVGAGDRGKP